MSKLRIGRRPSKKTTFNEGRFWTWDTGLFIRSRCDLQKHWLVAMQQCSFEQIRIIASLSDSIDQLIAKPPPRFGICFFAQCLCKNLAHERCQTGGLLIRIEFGKYRP